MSEDKNSKPLRLLYLPNENNVITQAGPRAAFDKMHKANLLDDYKIFSYLIEAQKLESTDKWAQRFLSIVIDFQPTIIFWQHISRFPITENLLIQLQNLPFKPFLVYHECDIYGKRIKRLTSPMKILTRNSDITFLVGLGEHAELFRKAGAKKVIFAPWCADTELFGKKWDPYEPGRKDVVMIGNRFTSKYPLLQNIDALRLPGAVLREQLAQQLYKRIGKRFKVYGRGWENFPFSAGSIAFKDQELVLRKHLLSVNWDHFPDTPFYFSDRLPNTLLSGVAHTTNYHPGYDLMFKNGEQLAYYHSVTEAVDLIDWMLTQPINFLIDMGISGERYVRHNLTDDIVYRRMVNIIKENMLT